MKAAVLPVTMGADNKKIVALAILLAVCAWLVWRNLLNPSGSNATAARPAVSGGTSPVDRALGSVAGAIGRAPQRRGGQHLLDLDPALRLDLLEASRAVEYKGSSRNIFEIYTPPPPPAALPPPQPPPEEQASEAEAPAPRAAPLPLKFYGHAQQAGQPRRAFLTDGEEIIIATEGDIVARYYKITRIGVSSLELEDTRSNVKQQLPLLQE